jgi:hypothetical protein
MAPKTKDAKGQRPISSFFFKKSSRASDAQNGRAPHSGTNSVDARVHVRQGPATSKDEARPTEESHGPPVKRMRVTEHGKDDDHPLTGESLPGISDEVASSLAPREDSALLCNPGSAGGSANASDTCKETLAVVTRPDHGMLSREAQPAAAAARHERFQNKLVLGPASGLDRRRSAQSIVAQKPTPLEEQVYELKRSHPGILLMIEVGP